MNWRKKTYKMFFWKIFCNLFMVRKSSMKFWFCLLWLNSFNQGEIKFEIFQVHLKQKWRSLKLIGLSEILSQEELWWFFENVSVKAVGLFSVGLRHSSLLISMTFWFEIKAFDLSGILEFSRIWILKIFNLYTRKACAIFF